MGLVKVDRLANHPELVPLCARWNYEAWGRDAGRSMEETIDSFMAMLDSSSREQAFVALVAGAPAGLCLLIESDLETHRHLRPWLASLFVAPEMRLMGAGTALARAVEDSARRQGEDVLYLYSSQPEYYERLGWERLEELGAEEAGACVMRRCL
ncbi:GNAT family N-acetyltransferase [Phyllobacterium sp. 21LDTY02-6]|uniref:GNAT family N-acetyltransferase n=1 Tax=Phyllobacterium sp. 21LDTY02-6 TaxID=2944903 RepID=UPI00201FBED4|nr:GNAT family N-acetyltransferase [Phyllobacterium sp. 21LDTY02-6]MCO4317098.1 GNAT family N-acetyltransferase [Phyllobacterium sp. 21LDTY02-6]